MLSDKERKGCSDLLRRLEKQELLSVLATVTNKQVSVTSTTGECFFTSHDEFISYSVAQQCGLFAL